MPVGPAVQNVPVGSTITSVPVCPATLGACWFNYY